jgi:hypothetical protein
MTDIESLIQNMKNEGKDNSQIIDELKNKGHTSQEIYSAMDKGMDPTGANLEPPSPGGDEMEPSSLSSQPMEPVENSESQDSFMQPMQKNTSQKMIPQRQNIEEIEEVAEAIVEEKLQEFSSSLGNIDMWKERVDAEISAIKQEILRLRNNIENLQITMVGKVEGYNKSVITMSAEMKALSKVMDKIMQPLTMNVKELGRITEKFKKSKN